MNAPPNETTREGREGGAVGNANGGQHRRRLAAMRQSCTHPTEKNLKPSFFLTGREAVTVPPFSFNAGARVWPGSLRRPSRCPALGPSLPPTVQVETP